MFRCSNTRQKIRESLQLSSTMTTIGAGFGRTIAIVALLCCGNAIRVAVDAFQARTTEFFRPEVAVRQNDAWIVPRNQRCWQSKTRGRLFASTVTAATTANATATKDIASEVFYPPMEASTKRRGRKRRAIQKLKQKHFSRPIDSPLFRTMLFPMVSRHWPHLNTNRLHLVAIRNVGMSNGISHQNFCYSCCSSRVSWCGNRFGR